MNVRQMAVSVAVAVCLCLALRVPSWVVAASAEEARFQLTAQSLEHLRAEGVPDEILEQLQALKDRQFNTADNFLEAVGQAIGNDHAVRYTAHILQHAAADRAETPRTLEQRVKALERKETAREEATRSIIRGALSKLGSKINEFVNLGGVFEVIGGWSEDFLGQTEGVLRLNTVELDLEVQVNDWTLGLVKLEFNDGTRPLFLTTENVETGIDRITLGPAYMTIGNPQKFPLFVTLGRLTLPFGISTGHPVTDVLSTEDPLTVEVFELRETAIGFGLGFPTPALTPATPPVTPPRVRPLVIHPLISALAGHLGYAPPPTLPPSPTPITPPPTPPLFNVGLYSYAGNTFGRTGGYRPGDHLNATAGFYTKGHCGRPYDQLRGAIFCPWALAVDVSYNTSVFDSRFLEKEYRSFLSQIGFVPGMSASVKATLGPVSFVGEWNAAIESARLLDDLGNAVRIRPSAWQVTLGYQFDWNPWVEAIGAQGNYVTVGYSESYDLEGVTDSTTGVPTRVGSVPRRRFILSAGEWVLDGVKVAIEYTHNRDYPKTVGGTGNSANAVFTTITLVW